MTSGGFLSEVIWFLQDLIDEILAFAPDVLYKVDILFAAKRWLGIAAALVIPAVIVLSLVLFARNDRKEAAARTADSSYFDGTLLGALGWGFLAFFLSLITFGLGLPWALCMVHRWEAKHTVVHGRRLTFDGTGWNLFGKLLLWGLLTVVTFGIFSFWLPVKNMKWKTAHTHFEDGTGGVSEFQKGAFALYFRQLFARLGTVLTLGIAYPAIHVSLLRWEYRNTKIDGVELRFTGTGGSLFVKYLVWALLVIVTFGIYGLFVPIRYLKWEKSKLDGVGLRSAPRAEPNAWMAQAARSVQAAREVAPDDPRAARSEGTAARPPVAKAPRDPYAFFKVASVLLAVSALALSLTLVLRARAESAAEGKRYALTLPEPGEGSDIATDGTAGVQTPRPGDADAAPTQAPGGVYAVTPAPVETPTPSPTIAAKNDLEALVLEGAWRYYTREELTGKSKYELSILRNGMYALCGKRFSKNQDVIDFFNRCDWYEPRYPQDADILPLMNDYEYANVMLIVDIETERGYR